MSEVSIREINREFKLGKTITKIAKESKFCFRRVRKLIEFLRTLKNWLYQVRLDDMHCKKAYKYMNSK